MDEDAPQAPESSPTPGTGSSEGQTSERSTTPVDAGDERPDFTQGSTFPERGSSPTSANVPTENPASEDGEPTTSPVSDQGGRGVEGSDPFFTASPGSPGGTAEATCSRDTIGQGINEADDSPGNQQEPGEGEKRHPFEERATTASITPQQSPTETTSTRRPHQNRASAGLDQEPGEDESSTTNYGDLSEADRWRQPMESSCSLPGSSGSDHQPRPTNRDMLSDSAPGAEVGAGAVSRFLRNVIAALDPRELEVAEEICNRPLSQDPRSIRSALSVGSGIAHTTEDGASIVSSGAGMSGYVSSGVMRGSARQDAGAEI